MKILIVNADDVGFSDELNSAAKKCYLSGAITGVSVMAGGRSFPGAAEMLRDIGKTEAGAHLTLTGDIKPVTPDPVKVKTLIADDGVFVPGYKELMLRYYRKKIDPREVYLEFSSQIERIKNEGLEITHLDSHEHIHMFPDFRDVVLKLARDLDVPYVRLPLERWTVIRKKFRFKDLLRHAGLKIYAIPAKKTLMESYVGHNDVFLGHFHSGRVSNEILCFIADDLGSGVAEVAVHPCEASQELFDEFPWYGNGPEELDALVNGGWKEAARSRGIRILSHKEAFQS